MRVLSIQQPWAHLVVRGVKQIEIRSWTARHEVRIAIHSSANFLLSDVERVWKSSSAVARCFAEQGWTDRDDIKALPRSAILGTVELVGVHRCDDVRAKRTGQFARNPLTDALEIAVRDADTGRLRPANGGTQVMPVPIPDRGYVWAFANPLEVEPIVDVAGQQHLWLLGSSAATELAEREERSRRGEWVATAVPRDQRKRSLGAWRSAWESELVQEAVRLQREAIIELEIYTYDSGDTAFDKRVRQEIRGYVGERTVNGADGKLHVRIEKRLRGLFGGRALVPMPEFEVELRRLLHEVTEDERIYTAGVAKHNRIVALLTELRARSANNPIPEATIEREVKKAYKKMILEEANMAEKTARWVEYPDVE